MSIVELSFEDFPWRREGVDGQSKAEQHAKADIIVHGKQVVAAKGRR
jgi:hypothetical protein